MFNKLEMSEDKNEKKAPKTNPMRDVKMVSSIGLRLLNPF